jgi:hypothetical protein
MVSDIYKRLKISDETVAQAIQGYHEIVPLLLDGKFPSQAQFEASWQNLRKPLKQIADSMNWDSRDADINLSLIGAKLDPVPEGELQTGGRLADLAILANDLLEETCPQVGNLEIINDRTIQQLQALKIAASMFIDSTGRKPTFSTKDKVTPGSGQKDFPELVKQFCRDIGINSLGIRDRFKQLRKDKHI